MAPPPAVAVNLARRLVTDEARSSADPAAWANAAETVCCQLRDHMTGLLGSGGVTMVIGRALHLAQREQAMLAGGQQGMLGKVEIDKNPSACFTGLAEALAAESTENAAAAAISIVAQLLGLLILLLGNELGTQPVRMLWPHVASSVLETDHE
jgi:hypothetical protein